MSALSIERAEPWVLSSLAEQGVVRVAEVEVGMMEPEPCLDDKIHTDIAAAVAADYAIAFVASAA